MIPPLNKTHGGIRYLVEIVYGTTVNREIFVLKIFLGVNFRVNKFS